MKRSPPLARAEDWVSRLEKSTARPECLTCDCFQGLLTQLELDFPQAAVVVARLKIPSSRMHGCLGCDPCPPGALYAEYLRLANEAAIASAAKTKTPSCGKGKRCRC